MSASGQGKDLREVATDLTSWYGFLAYLTGDLSTSWARDNYLDVTVLTLMGAHIRTPLPPADKTGPGVELSPLKAHFELATVAGSAKDVGLAYQAEELHDPSKAEALRVFLDDLLRDESCDGWLSWHIDREWPQHIHCFKGLVEKGYEDLVSILVPELTAEEIKDVNERALKDPVGFSAAATDTDRRLFTADVMRRGVYYRRITELLERQQVLHQTRRLSTSIADGVEERLLVLGFEPFLLAEIIRMDTAVAASRTERVAKWLEDVYAARVPLRKKWQLPDPYNFKADQKTLNSAVDRAVEISKDPPFSTGSREAHEAAELVGASIGGGVGSAMGLIVDSLLGGGGAGTLIGGAAGGIAGYKTGKFVNALLVEMRGNVEHAARTLASAGPALVRSSLTLRGPSESEAPRSNRQDPGGSRLDDTS